MNQDELIANSSLPLRKRFNGRSWLPSRGNVLLVFIVAGALLLYVRTADAVPGIAPAAASTSIIPYQGRLADSGGNPLNGSYSMTFKLYSLSSGGSALWAEARSGGNAVAVSNGLFNVMLGSQIPIPQSLFSTNISLWLGITVAADSEMTPRIQLGSAPFSLRAQSAAYAVVSSNNNERIETGNTLTQGAGVIGLYFAQPFSAPPIVLVTAFTTTAASFYCNVNNVTAAGYTGKCFDWNGTAVSTAEGSAYWIAIGE